MKAKPSIYSLTIALGVSLVYFKQESSQVSAKYSQVNERRVLASSAAAKPAVSVKQKEPSSPSHRDYRALLIGMKSGLSAYRHCYDEGGCASDESDPRAENFAMVKVLKQKLTLMNAQVNQWGWHSSELSQLARELITIDDGAIKEEALDLLLSQQPEPENVEAIAKGIFEYHDSNLVDQAVMEFQRHLYGEQAVLVHQSIRACLLIGSLLVRESVSANLGKFINPGSFQFYDDLSNDPAIDGPVRRNLKSTLVEYQLSQSGG
jgi:hypothetical protein